MTETSSLCIVHYPKYPQKMHTVLRSMCAEERKCVCIPKSRSTKTYHISDPRRLVRLFSLLECDRNQDLKIRTVNSAVEPCNLRATINYQRGYPTYQKSPFKLLRLRRTLLFLFKLPQPATTDYYTSARDCA